jgi:lipoyl(octanoyl) transferase
MKLETRWLGRIAFEKALRLQDALVKERAQGVRPDVLLLLEHEPVYTIGHTPDRSSLGDAAHLPYPVVEINRGGKATYHGPGQLVGYPILDLAARGRDLHRYLRDLEGALIRLLAVYGVEAGRRDGLTGVWIGPRKIASIGVGVRHWVSMHGFALNVCGDLAPFHEITPCGIAGVEMTNLERECGRPVDVRSVAERATEVFASCFGQEA